MNGVTTSPLRRTPRTYWVRPRLPGWEAGWAPSPDSVATLLTVLYSVLVKLWALWASRPFQARVPLLPRAPKQLRPHLRLLLKCHLLKEAFFPDHFILNTTFLPLISSHASALFFPGNTHFNLTLYHMLVLHTDVPAAISVPRESELSVSYAPTS